MSRFTVLASVGVGVWVLLAGSVPIAARSTSDVPRAAIAQTQALNTQGVRPPYCSKFKLYAALNTRVEVLRQVQLSLSRSPDYRYPTIGHRLC